MELCVMGSSGVSGVMTRSVLRLPVTAFWHLMMSTSGSFSVSTDRPTRSPQETLLRHWAIILVSMPTSIIGQEQTYLPWPFSFIFAAGNEYLTITIPALSLPCRWTPSCMKTSRASFAKSLTDSLKPLRMSPRLVSKHADIGGGEGRKGLTTKIDITRRGPVFLPTRIAKNPWCFIPDYVHVLVQSTQMTSS